jgi:hypothetical protein
MTRDEIIKLAESCSAPEWWEGRLDAWHMGLDLERFAALVVAAVYENEDMFTEAYAGGFAAGAAAEREKCAKVCEDIGGADAWDCAAAIRARVRK